jgi:hypothetical protein
MTALVLSTVAWSPAAHAGTYADASQRAAAWLESRQDAVTGSWRGSSDAHTFLQTTEAVLALHQVNRRHRPYYAGLTWLVNHEAHNLDARARRLLVLRAAPSSARPDVDALRAAMSHPVAGQSGWGVARRYRASPLDTALALDALESVAAPFSGSPAIAYLRATQLTAPGDQGWPSAAGTASDTYTTARVVQALAPFRGGDPSLATPLANALATLRATVNTASAPHLRAAAALAYLRMNPGAAEAWPLLDSLVGLQRADGGFDAGIFAGALIVQAFAAAEGTDATQARERVDVPDAALRTAINETLGRGALDHLNRGELARLSTLDISGRGVSSLQGLQYATRLTTLNAANNDIRDVGPIAGLGQLSTVDLSGNPCPGCGPQVASVPIPAWALAALAAVLMGLVRHTRRERSAVGSQPLCRS